MKKLIAISLLLVMALTAFASCGESSGTTSEKTSIAHADDGIPDGTDFGGKTIVILSNGDEYQQMHRESLTNDILNDAVYNREVKVNARLGVTIKFITDEDPEDKASTSVLTGLDEYQIVVSDANDMLKLAANNTFLNLNGDSLKYVNLDDKWYNQYFRETASIYDKLFCDTGSLLLTSIRKCSATAFNPLVLEERGLTEDMYELVNSGKWTIDKQLEMIKKCYSDMTGDGKTQDDAFGLCFDNSSALDYYWSAFDLSLLDRTEDGGLELTSNTEKFADALAKVYSMMYENNAVNCFDQDEYDDGGAGTYAPTIFAENRTLFITCTLGTPADPTMRNMKAEYGIIPMPKWDEAQADYYSCLRDGYAMFAIPKTNLDTDATSAVLQALSSDAYTYVVPVYYEKILKGRYMNDPESMAMLDIITQNINMDYSLVQAFALDKLSTEAWRTLLRAGKNTISSFWRTSKKRYTKSIETLLDKYAAIED